MSHRKRGRTAERSAPAISAGERAPSSDPAAPSPTSRLRWLPLAIAVAVAFAVSANTLANGFVNDDEYLILLNPWLSGASRIPSIFTNGAWAFVGSPTAVDYYRPVMHLAYLATFQLFGFRALGFHLVNLLLHVVNTGLLFLVATRLLSSLGETGARPQGIQLRSALSIPLISALLFATHPVHTDAVAWIAALPELSFTLCTLALVALHSSPAPWRRWRGPAAIALLALALLSKETAVTVPALLFLHDELARRGRAKPRPAALWVAYLVTTALYLALRHAVLSKTGMHAVAPWALTPWTLTASALLLFEQYVRLTVAPLHLSWWHPFRPDFSLANPALWVAIAVAVLFAVACRYAWRRDRLVAFALGLLAIPLAPAVYASAVHGMPVGERYLYLPSAGFVLLVGSLLSRLAARRPGRSAAIALVALLVCAYSWATIARNRVWKDSYTLYSDTARSHPDAPTPPPSLTAELLTGGFRKEAIAQLRVLATANPADAYARSVLGIELARQGDLEAALEQFEAAARLAPEEPTYRKNLERARALRKTAGKTGHPEPTP